MATPLLDHFRGCLLGQAIGDALGAPFETMPSEAIYYSFGTAREIIAAPPVDRLEYTDDTQMMIGVAEVLADLGRIDTDALMQAFVDNFDHARAYGAGTEQIVGEASAGREWKPLAAKIFPGGSFGNGAAMRAAPVGLLFHNDLDRVEREAVQSAVLTHAHPVGVDGARLFAVAVALVVGESTFDRDGFWGELTRRAKTDEFRTAIGKACCLAPDEHIGVLGTSIEADRSVPAALACFAASPGSYRNAIGQALRLGGDVDTICAMVGAMCGAHLGTGALPPHLLALLEDGKKGRTYIEALAGQLHARAYAPATA